MQQADVMNVLNRYLKDNNFKRVEDSFLSTTNLSKSEFFLNLSKMSQDHGDNWSSFAFYLKALVENYFVKYIELFQVDLYDLSQVDSLGQIALMVKTEFALFFVLLFFLFHFFYSQKNFQKIKIGLVVSFLFFTGITVAASKSFKLGLLKPQSAILNAPSKVFTSGAVSGDKDLFFIIESDEIFYKMINSRLETFWVRKKDTMVIY